MLLVLFFFFFCLFSFFFFLVFYFIFYFFFFSSRRRHTRSLCDWSSDVCSSDLSVGRATSSAQAHRQEGYRPWRLNHNKRSLRSFVYLSMYVGVLRSLRNSCRLSRDQRSSSCVLSVPCGRALLRRSANAGDLRTFYEDPHLEQSVMRTGHLVVTKTPEIPTVAAASSRRSNFWSGSGDQIPCGTHRCDSVSVFAI